MNSEPTSHPEYPTLEKRAEAAAWMARLRGPKRTRDVEQGFQRWQRASAEHSRAFELLTERLESIESLRARQRPARWQQQAHSRWRPALVGMAAGVLLVVASALLYLRDQGEVTQIGEQRMLTLSDGSRVYLNTDTRVVIRFDEGRRAVELKRGEALFEVTRDHRRPFIVVSGRGSVVALGTSFLVRRDEKRTSVTLIEGKVAVEDSLSAGSVPAVPEAESQAGVTVLSPGERLTMTGEQNPRLDHPSLKRITAWRYGQVAVDDLPLWEAIEEMNRYSTLPIRLERVEAADIRVGGFFRLGDSVSFARAVASTYGLRIDERSDEIVILGLPQSSTPE